MRSLTLAALLLLPASTLAQSEVSVHLYWLHEIHEARISPQKGELKFRACPTCAVATVAHPLAVRAAGGSLEVDGKSIGGNVAEVLSPCFLDVAGNPRVGLPARLVLRSEANRLTLTLHLGVEEYVAAVLAGESSNFSSVESLKAMSVAVRTYAAHFRGRHQPEGFDFCDTTHCQDFHIGNISERLRAAASATEGELLWYEGQPAATYYHRDCGGTTEAVEQAWPGTKAPYLRQLSDTFCIARGRSEWRSEITKEELRRALTTAGLRVPTKLQNLEIVSRTPSGRVARLRLTGPATLTVPADAFRLAVGRELGWERIRSDLYDVRPTGGRYIFHGYGAGHGVGLCQAGAARMGEQGRRYEEILRFYYPGTTLGLTAQGIAWKSLGGERIQVLTTRPQVDGFLVGEAERLMHELESDTGWRFRTQPQLRIYPSVAVFRDATGKPGWVAASTSGRVIRMQPVATLRSAGQLEETLRHELLHLLLESHAHPSLPLWFREGLVLVLSENAADRTAPAAATDLALLDRMLLEARTQDELRRAYLAAQAQVRLLIGKFGKAKVLGWVERGLPLGLLASPAQGH